MLLILWQDNSVPVQGSWGLKASFHFPDWGIGWPITSLLRRSLLGKRYCGSMFAQIALNSSFDVLLFCLLNLAGKVSLVYRSSICNSMQTFINIWLFTIKHKRQCSLYYNAWTHIDINDIFI
ncbi:hypothetical protein ACOSQ2_023882 [Xanthoceras sorbifolium]